MESSNPFIELKKFIQSGFVELYKNFYKPDDDKYVKESEGYVEYFFSGGDENPDIITKTYFSDELDQKLAEILNRISESIDETSFKIVTASDRINYIEMILQTIQFYKSKTTAGKWSRFPNLNSQLDGLENVVKEKYVKKDSEFKNKNRTSKRVVKAIMLIYKAASPTTNVDKTKLAEFIQYLTGLEPETTIANTNIYKDVKKDDASIPDLIFIRTLFEKIKLTAVVEAIDKEIKNLG